MDYQDIVDYATSHTGIDISYTNALKYVKKRRDQIVSTIRKKIGENFFYKTYYSNTVAGQNKYSFPVSTTTDWQILNIKRVEVKLKSTDTYRTYIQWNVRDIKSSDILALNSNNLYEIRGNYIYLYPTPTESITDGIFIEWMINLPDVTQSSIELDIFGDHTEMRNYIQVIADWLCADLYASNRQYEDKQYAEQEFNNSLKDCIENISNRGNSIIISQEPDLSILE